MTSSIAIVGMACIYPDARTPGELWENVLAQRCAFRRLPTERLRAEDYFSADPKTPDHTYAFEGAVIEGYEFDRVAFRIVGSTYRAADLTHWLALDVAAKALADAGFAEGKGLPRDTTGVLLGNSLTGEFSRANLMRLRWPYVRRVLDAALAKEKWTSDARYEFLEHLEAEYKSPFPAVGEETLAGGLSNTIAGRICNQFDLKGGGYTVDGACASSLLAVANACSSLAGGDLDVALAGGVDLSLDPFEIVGFAKTGALAADEMRVFDRRSAGFWPGEGCGFVVLMRHEDAVAQARRIYAVIRGWGISSDGSGGITRPEAEGQLEALRRAYRRAGFGADSVTYCEGHGTGTAVGDATELEVLSRARREARADAPPAVVGSVKANIGHTKAAAGLAGLIKATMAVHTQVLPPITGCEQPHEHFGGPSPALRVLRQAEVWPGDRALRASVSAMGFGGINAHLVLESVVAGRRHSLSAREQALSASYQDGELFLFGAESVGGMVGQLEKVLALAGEISRAELTDLAAQLERELHPGAVRGAVVAAKPAELVARLQTLRFWLQTGVAPRLRLAEGVYLGSGETPPRIGFLFPGQGSPTHLDGGAWCRRFETVRELYARAGLSGETDTISTRVMQPAIATASLAGLKVLAEFGLTAGVAIGHSLGELAALYWAGAYSEEALLRIARVRGAAMANLSGPTGAMVALSAPWQKVQPLLGNEPLSIVGYNSPRQTVVAGEVAAIARLEERAVAQGWLASRLPVSHAFHTMLVAEILPALRQQLAREKFSPLGRPVISTITGAALDSDADLRALLAQQVTSPVRFTAALDVLLGGGEAVWPVDLLIEVGPGAVLCGLVRDAAQPEGGGQRMEMADGRWQSSDLRPLTSDLRLPPVLALDAGGPSLKGLLGVIGAAFVAGAPVKHGALFADRFTRPFALDRRPMFFMNPCELAPVMDAAVDKAERGAPARREPTAEPSDQRAELELRAPLAPLDLVRRLVAERAELPVASIRDENRMLSDLHLNSITVGQLVSEAAKQLGLPRIVGLTDFANATVAETADALEELKRTGGTLRADDKRRQPPGVDVWFETFAVELVETKRPARRTGGRSGKGNWQVFAPELHSLANKLREEIARAVGSGVVLCLPEVTGEAQISLMLDAARAVMALTGERRFVLVQYGWGGAGFARTLHLETPGLITCVVNLPANHAGAAKWIVGEALAAGGHVEAHYDGEGRRWEPRLKLKSMVSDESDRSDVSDGSDRAAAGSYLPPRTMGELPIGPGDVLLVTGGGKGIAAEAALALGRDTGAALALLGRSDPETDPVLKTNLARFAAAGVKCCYVRGDVTEAESVRVAVVQAEAALGPVTALLHGAGTNTPQLLGALEEAAFRQTVAPKLQGVRNVLAAIPAERLKLLVTFGSIIARTGLRGEADYATANEWMTAFTEQFQKEHPRCRCRALEWSVWSGVGMGERLGRMDALIQQGIMPIPPDEGVRILLETLRHPAGPVAVVITGRFGEPPTLKRAGPELPLRRFLERTRAYYPGAELVVEAELSVESDPYLNDHVVQKERLFPAVLGLEAMAQAAMALLETDVPPRFEKVELARPIAVSPKHATTIRIAALRRGPGLVEVCVRSEETDFQVDHFRAWCRMGRAGESDTTRLSLSPARRDCLSLDPHKDLYGRILFHEGRFQRLRSYQLLKAGECVAEIAPAGGQKAEGRSPTADFRPLTSGPWFGPYLPAEFVLGDPGARDATIHAIQACVPHRRILPTGIDEVVILRTEPGVRFVRAKERGRDGNDFTYDLEVTDASGSVVERWTGLHLRAVEELANREAWPEALLAPYLERRLEELAGHANVAVALESGGKSRSPGATDEAIQQALGRTARIWRRPDGKPETIEAGGVSAAHCRDLTLAVAGADGVACDLEEITARSSVAWRGLLSEGRFKLAELISRERGEGMDTAATRMWAAAECLKKIGLPPDGPLVLESTTPDGWGLLRAGGLTIATCAVSVAGVEAGLVVAVAFRSRAAGEQERARTVSG